MTIFNSPSCFTGYGYRAIKADGLAAFRAAADTLGGNHTADGDRTLLRLECYLQVTGASLAAHQLRSPIGTELIHGFVGAMYATRFEDQVRGRKVYIHLHNFRRTLKVMGHEHIFSGLALSQNIRPNSEQARLVDIFQNAVLVEPRVEFWRGWTLKNKHGENCCLRLFPIHERLGAVFTNALYSACSEFYRGGLADRLCCINELAVFILNYPGKIKSQDFQNPEWLGKFLNVFFITFITEAHTNGKRVSTALREWAQFLVLLDGHILGKAWTIPTRSIPRPVAKSVRGQHTNVRTTAAGYEVKSALITEIPLMFTDTQATELLFQSIRADVDTLTNWAQEEAKAAWLRFERRVRHTPPVDEARSVLTERTFTYDGSMALKKRTDPSQKRFETAWELAIPNARLLLAHASLLVVAHPKITSSFLEKLNIFDSNGRRIGLVETDAGHYLVGEKLRKGPSLAEQRIKLTPETTEIVRQIIALTEPLRDYCRKANDVRWRRLFLAAPSMGARPKTWNPTKTAYGAAAWLSQRLVTECGIDEARATSLADRFSLKRLRASAAVLVYLETGDVQKMADALGHESWHPRLLDHYLPRLLQEFFVERWIRLFQTGIVCEALCGSPFILQATTFANMTELDAFLENHALKKIPLHLQDPDALHSHLPSPGVKTKVVFGIDVGILTILLSIEGAVSAATRPVCGRAQRWASISERLVPHIRSNGEFADMLSEAQRHCQPGLMDPYIYG